MTGTSNGRPENLLNRNCWPAINSFLGTGGEILVGMLVVGYETIRALALLFFLSCITTHLANRPQVDGRLPAGALCFEQTGKTDFVS